MCNLHGVHQQQRVCVQGEMQVLGLILKKKSKEKMPTVLINQCT
jgi:hypothetical protein